MDITNSAQLFAEAQGYIPGGVNSPVRSFKSVGGIPLFIRKGQGSHIWDADGNEFIDYVGSWVPLILGHAHPEVLRALGSAFVSTAHSQEDIDRTVAVAESASGKL